MSKHTAGPWTIDKRVGTWGVYPDGKIPQCHCNEPAVASITPERVDGDNEYCFSGSEEQQANATLIAAAPELLSMLEELEWADYRCEGLSKCPACQSAKYRGHAKNCELAALIRKAKGEDHA